MAPKVNKGKGVASSNHGSKRERTTSEEEHGDVNMAPLPLRRYMVPSGSLRRKPLDDDVATEDEMARIDSDIESSDDDEEDSKMGEAALAPTAFT
ncbi:hypothetical protein HAX54_016848 [Datura stramonium]|uniref:Uncharacterized protein n=1 Tax=Datura stramonium TaxID=4076 RepID=A0ABS8ULZ6_DATST|nr:hypothetical protein [Datura stramonium]